MAAKKIIETLLKASRKKPAEDAIRKGMRKELTDVGTPASTAATPSSGSKITEGEIPETAKYGPPRTKFRNKLDRLQYEYDGLKPSAKRAERTKGRNSEYYDVFKARNMTPADGKKIIPMEEVRQKMINRKTGGPVPKPKPTPPSEGAAINRGNRMSEMEAGAAKAMKAGAAKAMKRKYMTGGEIGCGAAMRGYGKGPYKKK